MDDIRRCTCGRKVHRRAARAVSRIDVSTCILHILDLMNSLIMRWNGHVNNWSVSWHVAHVPVQQARFFEGNADNKPLSQKWIACMLRHTAPVCYAHCQGIKVKRAGCAPPNDPKHLQKRV